MLQPVRPKTITDEQIRSEYLRLGGGKKKVRGSALSRALVERYGSAGCSHRLYRLLHEYELAAAVKVAQPVRPSPPIVQPEPVLVDESAPLESQVEQLRQRVEQLTRELARTEQLAGLERERSVREIDKLRTEMG